MNFNSVIVPHITGVFWKKMLYSLNEQNLQKHVLCTVSNAMSEEHPLFTCGEAEQV